MPPHQISLKEMWLHFVCSRAKFRAVGQRWTDYYNWMKVNWKQLCSWSDGDLLYVLLKSVLNIFGRNVWWYYEGRPSGKPAVGFFHSTPNAILIRRFGRKDRLGQEFPFRCEMEASLARIETNKHTKKLLFSPHSSEQCCETGLSAVMEKFPFWAIRYHSP